MQAQVRRTRSVLASRTQSRHVAVRFVHADALFRHIAAAEGSKRTRLRRSSSRNSQLSPVFFAGIA
jgi:hypothetical protein